MPAIAIHHTATSDAAWDGPANRARLRADESETYYRSAHAWQDPGADAETKTAYKFIHHEVAEGGDVGAANVRACQTAIGVLNGGRGGTTIPAGDRRGVWAHLAAHLEDADLEPPELRAHVSGLERRSFPAELRLVGEGASRRIDGYAAVFDVLSVPLWGFREKIRAGAFAKTIQEADVRALWNHDSNFVLGRTKASTLRLAEDARGLKVNINPPDTQWARDFMLSLDRGDVDQMSFSFKAMQEEWSIENGETVRTLVEVALGDVSPVTFPAYPQTSVQARAFFGLEARDLEGALSRLEAGQLTTTDRQLLEHLMGEVETRLTPGPAEGGHPAEAGAVDMGQVQVRLARMRRRIELAEIR